MNLLKENIQDIVQGIVEKNGYFLIDLIVRGSESNRVLEIFIDGENNVTAEDCAKISKEINSILSVSEMIDFSYRLDVSSPGVDRPLKFLKQFPKHLNRKFEVSYKQNDETKSLTGKLLKVDGEYLLFLTKNGEEMLNFNNILNAKVLISFS
jgi:ribosome maturation factor RimP